MKIILLPLSRLLSSFTRLSAAAMSCMTLFMGNASAQDMRSQNLTWKLDSAVNLQNARGMQYEGEIVTNRTISVRWVQKKGEKVSVYDVVRVDGEWNDINQTGQLVYHLTRDGHGCTATFQRTGGRVSVTLDYGGGIRSQFLVGSVK